MPCPVPLDRRRKTTPITHPKHAFLAVGNPTQLKQTTGLDQQTFPQKVRIVLAEKDVTWTSRYVSLVRGEQLTPEFEEMNPRGERPRANDTAGFETVPCLDRSISRSTIRGQRLRRFQRDFEPQNCVPHSL